MVLWKWIRYQLWRLGYWLRARKLSSIKGPWNPSRSYMRKIYAPALRSIDREVNLSNGSRGRLLIERRLLVARRRRYIPLEE